MMRSFRNAPDRPFPRPFGRGSLRAAVLVIGIAGLAPLSARPAPPPVPGGPIGTLDLGQYNCERDGTAGGPVGIRLPQYDFRVVTGSNYKTPDGVRGSYLMTGDQVIMTGGALRGMKMHRTSRGFLRQTGPDGVDVDVRCVLTRTGRGTFDAPASPDESES